MPRTRVLVLGATGFVGRNALASLRTDENVEVIAACRDRGRLSASFDGQTRIGDLRDPAYRARLFEGVDVACFAAAWSALHGHARESRNLFYEPLEAALDAAVKAGVKRVVLTSAIDVANVDTTSLTAVRRNLAGVWPHLANVRALEESARRRASAQCKVVVLRFGFFTGEGVTIGMVPSLLPRLAARLVPFIDGGRARLRLVDGADVGRAFARAAIADGLAQVETFDIVGPSSPTFRELTAFLHAEFGYPQPWFSVSSATAFHFAHLAELVSRVTPWEPLITRSLVFLLEPFEPTNDAATRLGFTPRVAWLDSVRRQVREIHEHGSAPRLVDHVTSRSRTPGLARKVESKL